MEGLYRADNRKGPSTQSAVWRGPVSAHIKPMSISGPPFTLVSADVRAVASPNRW